MIEMNFTAVYTTDMIVSENLVAQEKNSFSWMFYSLISNYACFFWPSSMLIGSLVPRPLALMVLEPD